MKKIKSTIAMEPERVVIRTGDLETVFTYPPSATGPQIAVSAADQIAILHTLIANKRLDCERLRAILRQVRDTSRLVEGDRPSVLISYVAWKAAADAAGGGE